MFIESSEDIKLRVESEESSGLAPLNMNLIKQSDKQDKFICIANSPKGSSKDNKKIAEDSPRAIYLKKFAERFKLADELLKHSPEDQRIIEESFRLKKNPDSPAAAYTRKPEKRGTFSEVSQKIIEERLESHRNPKPLAEETLFTQIRDFWGKGTEGTPAEDKHSLFKVDPVQGFKINSETPILEHVKTDNKILLRSLGINEPVKPTSPKPNTEAMSPQLKGETHDWLKLKRRAHSLCGAETIGPKNKIYDIVERSEKDNRDLWELEYNSTPSPQLRQHSVNSSESESEKPNKKYSIFRRLSVPKIKITPKIKLSEKSQDQLQTILGDKECVKGDDSQKSSLKDINSTMNTMTSLSSPLQSPNFLVKECYTPQYKKSKFNLPRASSLKSETFLQMLKSDLGVETIKALPKSTSKKTTTKAFNWKTEESGSDSFIRGSPQKSSTLPPLKQNAMRKRDLSLTQTRVSSSGDKFKSTTQAVRLTHDNLLRLVNSN